MSLQFVPFRTFIDPALWAELSRRRLDEWQLECPAVEARASYSIYKFEASNHGKQTEPILTIGHDALMKSDGNQGRDVEVVGELKLLGTLKEFKELDRKAILKKLANKLWTEIESGIALDDPSKLNTFNLIGFADVKHYVYYYTICTPALLFPNNLKQSSAVNALTVDDHQTALEHFLKNPNKPFIRKSDGQLAELKSILDFEESVGVTLIFGDPSPLSKVPGWPLRNLIANVAPQWTQIKVLALRSTLETSDYFIVSWDVTKQDRTPDTVGWSNAAHVNLKSAFDPTKLMENSVDMNLKLVRWRLVPSLKLAPLAELKVLMLGAGTLGCNLARNLLGWGVRNFTFVDNSVISYNNPVRQCLYEFEDCKAGNRQKAMAAANAIRRIFPSVNAQGFHMKIPMPGHTVGEAEKESVLKECAQLEKLIEEHDVVFLVMDSRESRWLPTVLATKHEKLTITVAMGFDTFVVMRHGVPLPDRQPIPHRELSSSEIEVSGSDLGCYFCNDVTAPGNSMDDRTLDQNCTISRAGISSIASGIATELLASLIQHEKGGRAPALLSSVNENSSLLGGTPHQVRGFLTRYQFMTPTVYRFERCTACGVAIQKEFAKNGNQFLLSVFSDPHELEKVSGLIEIQHSMTEVDLAMMEVTDEEFE
ncbi:Ubiquitin-like modifier-activating enzyme ATG7 [Aphelenchoides besseyi]|nr:Ubiquitin-like modifier-activating enzyme ATG7 [Aphelenchoides besseyi]